MLVCTHKDNVLYAYSATALKQRFGSRYCNQFYMRESRFNENSFWLSFFVVKLLDNDIKVGCYSDQRLLYQKWVKLALSHRTYKKWTKRVLNHVNLQSIRSCNDSKFLNFKFVGIKNVFVFVPKV